MKLIDITEITGRIILKSGLRIGAGDMEMRIGGVDNPVLKHPHTLEPYIPGSSLKGKVRSLLEMESGLMAFTGGNPVAVKDLNKNGVDGAMKSKGEKILKIFGAGGSDAEEIANLGPTRVSFADCPLHGAWKEKALAQRLAFTEVKSENAINRIKGVAEHPRFTERVPADSEFTFSVTLKTLDLDAGDDLLHYLLSGLKLLEMDALGGSGSRGYGRIAFEFDDQDLREKFAVITPFPREG